MDDPAVHAGVGGQKKLPSLKCSFQPGAGRPSASVRSKPYAQSMPIGPSGEMMLSPTPAPRNRRGGMNLAARAPALPAAEKVLVADICRKPHPAAPPTT